MKIIGPDSLVFGVDDVDGRSRFLVDYGLKRVEGGSSGGTFEALDGTSIINRAALKAIGAELSRDRDVHGGSDGLLRSVDDDGYPIAFQLTRRRSRSASSTSPSMSPGRMSC